MPLHRFAVGQSVEFLPGWAEGNAPPGLYTVVRLLPGEPHDREYRVRSVRDGHERVARERQLRGADADPWPVPPSPPPARHGS